MEVETRWQQLSEAGPLSLLHDEATPGPLPISRGKEGRPCRLGIRTPDCSPSWLTLTWWQVGKRLTILDLLSANYIKTIFATEMWGIKCYKRFSKGPWWKSMGCCHHPGLSKEGMAVLLFFSISLSLKCIPATVVGMFFPFSLALSVLFLTLLGGQIPSKSRRHSTLNGRFLWKMTQANLSTILYEKFDEDEKTRSRKAYHLSLVPAFFAGTKGLPVSLQVLSTYSVSRAQCCGLGRQRWRILVKTLPARGWRGDGQDTRIMAQVIRLITTVTSGMYTQKSNRSFEIQRPREELFPSDFLRTRFQPLLIPMTNNFQS